MFKIGILEYILPGTTHDMRQTKKQMIKSTNTMAYQKMTKWEIHIYEENTKS